MFFSQSESKQSFPKLKTLFLKKLFEIISEGPLNGTLVVEIGQHVSGPMVGERLSRKGAFVVKVEVPKTGDPARIYLSPEIFASLNAGKASVTIGEEDLDLYLLLLMLADVIVDNRSPEAKEKDKVLNQFLNSMDKTHPVIFCSIVGYEGEENKHLLALDVSVQAATGMAYVNASEPNHPLKVGFVVLDEATAMEASELIVSHLFALSKGKKIPSQDFNVIKLQVSMANVSAYLMTGQYLNCLKQNKEPSRYGNKDNWLSPFSFYSTKDGMISLAIINEDQYKRMCLDVLEDKDLYHDFSSNVVRMKNSEAFEAALTKILTTQTTNYWYEKCVKFKIAASKINSVTEALSEPFAKRFFTKTLNGTTVIANPYTTSLYEEKKLSSAPTLNEHRESLMCLVDLYESMKKINTSLTFQDIYYSTISSQCDTKDEKENNIFKAT